MEKIKNLVKASPIAMAVIGLMVAGVASAALLTIYGHTTGTADVKQSVLFGDGGTTQAYEVGNSDPVAGNVYYNLTTLENNASDKSAVVQLNTLYSRPGWVTPHTPEDGITTSYKEWVAPVGILDGVRPTAVYNNNNTGSKKYEAWYKVTEGATYISYAHWNGSWSVPVVTNVAGGYDAPSVTKENGKYYMVNYGSGNNKQFNIYTSDDGITWTDKGVIYSYGGSWDKIDNPKILKDEVGYKMYYQHKESNSSDTKYYIFLATSDAKSMKEIAADASASTESFIVKGGSGHGGSILEPGTAGEWDSFRVMQPTVFKSGNKDYTMLYTGYATGEDAKIGYAVSDDGISWDKVKVSDEGYDKTLGTYALKTSVVKTNDNLVLFYQDNNDPLKIKWTWLDSAVNGSGQMTIQGKEIKPFFIENDFAINLQPLNYSIKTEVIPVTAI